MSNKPKNCKHLISKINKNIKEINKKRIITDNNICFNKLMFELYTTKLLEYIKEDINND